MRHPGTTVGRYRLLSLLGKGGMGEVYEAEDTLLGRRVALKLVAVADAGGDEARDRMIREARAAAAFEHPNAVLVLDAGFVEEAGLGTQTFLAMELVRGQSLRAKMGAPDVERPRKIRWLVEAARALAAAHARGLVHRDVKPDNLMIRDDGALKVLDFGIAKRTAAAVDPSAPTEAGQSLSTLTKAGTIVGTPRYASPEQLRGEPLDGRADQFSWGVTAYEVLTGRLPFDAPDSVTLISQILSKRPEPLRAVDDELPKEVERAVLRALEKDPGDRFESMAEAASALEPFAEVRSLPGDVPTEQTGALSVIPPKTRKVLSRTAKVAVYLTAAFGAFVLVVLGVSAVTGNLRFDTGGRTSASAAMAAEAGPVSHLACSAAVVEGDAQGLDLGPAVGVGTCARLGIALGVDWWPSGASAPDATQVEVRATVGTATNKVVVRAAGKEATAEDARLIGAMRAAAEALANELPRKPCDEKRRAAWGVTDPDAAWRVERTWRRFIMSDVDDPAAEGRKLAEEVPDAPWAHAMVACSELYGSKRQKEGVARGIELAEKLPPARAKGLKGLLLMYRTDADKPEALRLLRQGYAEDPTDADIAGLYASVAISLDSLDEGFSVVDRVADEQPSLSVVPLRNAVGTNRFLEPARRDRYLKRLLTVLPEDAAGWPAFFTALDRGDLAAAGEVLRFRAALVGPERSEEMGGVRVALLTGELDRALEMAKRRLSVPDAQARASAGRLLVAVHLFAGRTREGLKAAGDQIATLRDQDSKVAALIQVWIVQRALRRLGEDLPADLLEIDPLTVQEIDLPSRVGMRAEMELGRGGSKEAAKKALAALEKEVDRARREDASSARLSLLPLVRRARGDAAAVAIWRATSDALEGVRTWNAFDAALALEAEKAPADEIAAAYLLAMDPMRAESRPFDYLFAALRLAERFKDHAAARDQRVVAVAKRKASLPPELVERALAPP